MPSSPQALSSCANGMLGVVVSRPCCILLLQSEIWMCSSGGSLWVALQLLSLKPFLFHVLEFILSATEGLMVQHQTKDWLVKLSLGAAFYFLSDRDQQGSCWSWDTPLKSHPCFPIARKPCEDVLPSEASWEGMSAMLSEYLYVMLFRWRSPRKAPLLCPRSCFLRDPSSFLGEE